MANKKAKKSRIIKIAMFALCIYMVGSFVVINVDIAKRKESLATMQSELEEQQIINNEITKILESGEKTDYIIRFAREELGLVFPDEKVFIDFKRK